MEDYSSYSKSSLRIIFKKRVLAISSKDKRSDIIVEKLLSSDFLASNKSILLYYSSPLEVSTKGLINSLFLLEKELYLPSTDQLAVTKITRDTLLVEKLHGILEPETPSGILPNNIGLAIIPGLAFDRRGYRIGHGGGWYDRVLEKLSVKTTIGMCFHEQLVKKLPINNHDMPVDIIVTDHELIRLK